MVRSRSYGPAGIRMASDVPDLQAAWDAACTEFIEATGIDPKSATKSKSSRGQDILDKFNTKKAKDELDRRKIDKAKTAIGNTITGIERIGKIAAQGASMVFGSPATIAMGCVSFLVDAGFEYKNIAHNIDDLFGRIATIMQRFQIYRDYESIMEPPMIRVAHKLLMAVVSICGRCIKIMKRNVIRKVLSVTLFSDDGGIKDQLSLLTALESEELQVKGTLNLVAAEANKRNIVSGFSYTHEGLQDIKASEARIMDSVSQISAGTADERALKELKKKLEIEDTTSISEKEYRNNRAKLAAGACSWLKDDGNYQAWSNIADTKEPLLVLKGDEGCGKSYATTAIIRDLWTRYPQGLQDTNRISIAYYYFSRQGLTQGSFKSKKAAPSLREALQSWAWQIVNNDVFYRKGVQSTFKHSPEISDLGELWKKLFLDHSDNQASLFLLLDGIHEMEDDGLNDLKQIATALSTRPCRVKLLVSTRTPFADKLNAHLPGTVPMTNLKDKTQADMEGYIREKANNLAIFQRRSPQVQQLKEKVCSGLLQAVHGSFLLADLKLGEISGKDNPEEVMDVVEMTRKGGNLNDTVRKAIRECNRQGSEPGVKEPGAHGSVWFGSKFSKTAGARQDCQDSIEMQTLNTLLLWVMYGEWTFELWELESILFVQRRESSLQPIFNQIRDKFSAFLTLSSTVEEVNTFVTLKYDSIADYFKVLSAKDEPSEIRSTEALSKREIRLVQNFFQKLCEQEVYDKLGIGAFFDQKLSESDMSVAVDCENAHARIALDCLQVLVGELPEESNGLQYYARRYLSSHLKQIDLDTVDPRLKSEIGPALVKAFTKARPIEIINQNTRLSWAFNDEGVKEILRMLQSSAVTKRIREAGDDNQKWIKEIFEHSEPEIALLERSAEVKAVLWIEAQKSSEVLDHFRFLYGYCNKIWRAKDFNVERVNDRSADYMTIGEIESVLQLTHQLVGMSVPGTKWLRNVGIVFCECGYIAEAVHHFSQALSIDSDYLAARESLAMALAKEVKDGPPPDWEKALYHQEFLIERARKGVRIHDDIEPENFLDEDLLPNAALWYRKVHKFDRAREIYDELLRKSPLDDDLRLEYIFLLCETKSFGEIVEMLQELKGEYDEDAKADRLSQFFCSHAWNTKYHSSIVQVYKQVGNILEIKNHYRQAVDAASEQKKKQVNHTVNTYGLLAYYLAKVLYEHSGNPEEREEAIELWERVVALDTSQTGLLYSQMLCARRLGNIYIAKAIEAGHDSSTADQMLTKLRKFESSKASDNVDTELTISQSHLRSLMGRYYSAVQEFKKAKEQLRADVEVGIKLLSDDDPENDYQGYRKLGDAFMDFGDDNNAIAAWMMIQPTRGIPHPQAAPPKSADTLVEDPSAYSANSVDQDCEQSIDHVRDGVDNSEDHVSYRPSILRRSNASGMGLRPTGPISYSCDGECGTTWTFADDIYVCRECLDVQFDERCVTRLQRGNLGLEVCDPEHTFMHVPSWDLESFDRARNKKVLVGDQVLGLGEWLDGIKKAWDLP
ncbi:MAG: hypothetical protein Q9227_002134 [Pyrenula ochraceoflavens]